MEAKINALGNILDQALNKQKDMKVLIARSLKDSGYSEKHVGGSGVLGKPSFELQFKDMEPFMRFEKELKENSEMFSMLVSQLNNITPKGEEKYIKSCWRHIMEDSVALNFCWKGTLTKPSIQTMATTAAIKEAFIIKYPTSSQVLFEQTNVTFFQQAKSRYVKKLEYQSKVSKTKEISS